MFRPKKTQAKTPAPDLAGDRQRLLLDALAELTETLDLDELLERILSRSLAVSGAERAMLLLGNEAESLSLHQARSDDGSAIDPTGLVFSRSTVERAVSASGVVSRVLGGDTEAMQAGQSLFELKLRSVMCAPLYYRKQLLGAVYVDSRVQRKEFTTQDEQLFEALARQAAIAIENARLLDAATEKARLERELELAAEIQRDLLPGRPPSVPGFDLAGEVLPCEQVSGDFLDYIVLADGRVACYICDVTGHGVGPALVAAEVRGEVRALLPIQSDPGELLGAIHANLVATLDAGRFVTMLLLLIDPRGRTISYANAGHPAGILLSGGGVRALAATSPPLGIDGAGPFQSVGVEGIEPGDAVFLVSDGLCEMRNADGDLFGDTRTEAACLAATGSAAERAAAVLSAAQEFAEHRDDDMTAICGLFLP